MRRAMWTAALWTALGTMVASPALAQTGWVDGSPVQARIRVGANGDTYVGVWVQAPQQAPRQARAPMAVSLVIDTSGSMAGDKIESARMAAASLLESLVPGDIVSIYGFSHQVVELAPPTTVTVGGRAALMQRLSMLYAAGGTNLYGGVQVAAQRMAQAPSTHPVRRIFLISDGHANVGPSDTTSLSNLAASATESLTQITAIGVGLSYDQATLSSMVVRSSGRLYHLQQPQQMATILRQEMSLLAQSVALNGVLEVIPAPGVTILESATTGAEVVGGRLRLPLGSVYAGQEREVLFRAHVDTATLGERPLAQLRLAYRDPESDAARTQSRQVTYRVTRGEAGLEASRVPRVEAMIAQHQATTAQRRAAELLRQGQSQQAAIQLDEARRTLARAASAAPAAPSSARLSERARELDVAATRARAARTEAERTEATYDFEDSAMSAEGY